MRSTRAMPRAFAKTNPTGARVCSAKTKPTMICLPCVGSVAVRAAQPEIIFTGRRRRPKRVLLWPDFTGKKLHKFADTRNGCARASMPSCEPRTRFSLSKRIQRAGAVVKTNPTCVLRSVRATRAGSRSVPVFSLLFTDRAGDQRSVGLSAFASLRPSPE